MLHVVCKSQIRNPNSPIAAFRTLSLLASAILAACPADAADAPPQADLVLLNGTIVTVDADRPQVQALAARGDKIVARGTAADLQPLVGPRTRVIDLAGRLAIPGFIEGHGHLTGLGEARLSLDLGQLGKLADVVVLSKNILTVPAEEIPAAQVDFTILGGAVAYERRSK